MRKRQTKKTRPAVSPFEAASKAAEGWLSTIEGVAYLGQNLEKAERRGARLEQAYLLLLSPDDAPERYSLLNSFNEHSAALLPVFPKLSEWRESPVRWNHGRRAIANRPEDVRPHVWSSAHEAAYEIAQLAIELLAVPLQDTRDDFEQYRVAYQLLSDYWLAFAMPSTEVAELQERIRHERARLLAVVQSADQPDGEQSDNPPSLPAEPKVWLKGWHDITAALKMRHDDREDIKRLNKKYDGPIRSSGKGTKPMVDRAELLAWWDTLAQKQQELANQQSGRSLSAEAKYNYGREGVVAPGIGGGVKKRRSDQGKRRT